MKWESPRGPISIDPATRDIVQNVYIRRVEKVGNDIVNVEFDDDPEREGPDAQVGRRPDASTKLHDGAIAYRSPHRLIQSVNDIPSSRLGSLEQAEIRRN